MSTLKERIFASQSEPAPVLHLEYFGKFRSNLYPHHTFSVVKRAFNASGNGLLVTAASASRESLQEELRPATWAIDASEALAPGTFAREINGAWDPRYYVIFQASLAYILACLDVVGYLLSPRKRLQGGSDDRRPSKP